MHSIGAVYTHGGSGADRSNDALPLPCSFRFAESLLLGKRANFRTKGSVPECPALRGNFLPNTNERHVERNRLACVVSGTACVRCILIQRPWSGHPYPTTNTTKTTIVFKRTLTQKKKEEYDVATKMKIARRTASCNCAIAIEEVKACPDDGTSPSGNFLEPNHGALLPQMTSTGLVIGAMSMTTIQL
jgi:hypothetical protein